MHEPVGALRNPEQGATAQSRVEQQEGREGGRDQRQHQQDRRRDQRRPLQGVAGEDVGEADQHEGEERDVGEERLRE